jgi:hypothetical protein
MKMKLLYVNRHKKLKVRSELTFISSILFLFSGLTRSGRISVPKGCFLTVPDMSLGLETGDSLRKP